LAFDALSVTVMTLPRRVTRPAFCQAFIRRLARCVWLPSPAAAELGRRQVGVPAWLTRNIRAPPHRRAAGWVRYQTLPIPIEVII
jgi:hypothetical protein